MIKKLPKERMDGKTKTTDEVNLVEAHFINIRMAGPIIVIRDPNLDQRRKLRPIPNPPLVFLLQSTTNTPSFVRSRWGRNLKDSLIPRQGQTRFKLTRPNLLTKHCQGLSNS